MAIRCKKFCRVNHAIIEDLGTPLQFVLGHRKDQFTEIPADFNRHIVWYCCLTRALLIYRAVICDGRCVNGIPGAAKSHNYLTHSKNKHALTV